MISIKHTTIIKDIIIFVNAHTIVGKAFVGFALSPFVSIQFHIIGKFVLSFIQQHQPLHHFTTAPSQPISADTVYSQSQQINHSGTSQHHSA